MVADVGDHRADQVHRVGQQALLDLRAQQVAEDTAKVLVASVGEERSAIGQHADEAAQKAEVRQRNELLLDAVLLIQEPPGAAELHFAGRCASWKLPSIVATTSFCAGFRL